MEQEHRLEFIVALTEHRHFGQIFLPYLIERQGPYFAVKHQVLLKEIGNYGYPFTEKEKELVKITNQYSDEKLASKFSRNVPAAEFLAGLKPDYFQKHIAPYMEKHLYSCVMLLMQGGISLFEKEPKYANLYDEDLIQVPDSFAEAVFEFDRNEAGTHYTLRVFQENQAVRLINKKIKVIVNDPCVLLVRDRLLIFRDLDAKKLNPFLARETLHIPVKVEPKYYESFVLNVIRDHPVKASGFEIREKADPPQAVLSLEPDLKLDPVLVLRFFYAGNEFLPNSTRKVAVKLLREGERFVFSKTTRLLHWEASITNFLREKGLVESNGYFLLKGQNLLDRENALHLLVSWLSANRPELGQRGVEIKQERWGKTYFTGGQSLDFELKKVSDWFDIYAHVQFGEYRIPFIKLKKYILNDIREFELPNGEVALLPAEWFARYKDLLTFGKTEGERLVVQQHHFTLLKNRIQGISPDIFSQLEQAGKGVGEEVALPPHLKATLRSYQKEGYQWMYSLHKNGMGGCLADDMGLGKTLQTLTLLLKLKRLKKAAPTGNALPGQLTLFTSPETGEAVQPPSLIVLPTSLVHNWESEIRKFTPTLKAYKHVGALRNRSSNLARVAPLYDVILTTYGTLRNDFEMLSQMEFFYLILDESQYIKNPASKTYKAVMGMKARRRLVLTGTPIENSLADLWAQMNFLNRGLLGNLAFFRQNFITPVEKHGDADVQQKLQLLIRPFVLRRTKTEVARDLPPLMEQVLYCPMTEKQQSLYEQEKSVIRNAILANIERDGVARSSLVVLQGLTKLRQLANHPSMLDSEEDSESGKFNEIVRSLGSLLAEKHKVLVFSSFVTHLELLRQRIEAEGWKYSLLTGKTANRAEVIREFQEDPANGIFLISLKAGGVGLNLTGADYVFIIDPWWNPAAENQAISRAHRIGQDKHVFVYRFITENSIEEKIQRLKEHKSALADKFINSNNPFQTITREEIMGLFG